MVAPSFDPTHAVRFDLPRGSVRARGNGDALLLVPSAALVELVLVAPAEAVEALGRALGSAIGRRAAARMGDPAAASIDEFITQLAGEAALTGIGVMSMERWGRALVVVVQESPLTGTLLVPVVASALEAASGRKVWCALLTREEQMARILIASERAAERVRGWIAAGTPWGEALTKLHGDGA
jgi:hypothetical protein